MKLKLLPLFAIFAAALASVPASAAPQARMNMDTWDLGTVQPGVSHEITLVVESANGEPLKIMGISRPLIAPLTYEFHKDELGLSHTIKIVLTPVDPTEETVEYPFGVRTDAPDQPKLELVIRYKVAPPDIMMFLVFGEKTTATRELYELGDKLKPGSKLGLDILDLEQEGAYKTLLFLESLLGRMLNEPVSLLALPDESQGGPDKALLASGPDAVKAALQALIAVADKDGKISAEQVRDALTAHGGPAILPEEPAPEQLASTPPVGPSLGQTPSPRHALPPMIKIEDAPAESGLRLPRGVWMALGAVLGLVVLLVARAGAGPTAGAAALTFLDTGAYPGLLSLGLLGLGLLASAAWAQETAPEPKPAPASTYDVSVFATGGTEGALEVCGCAQGQFGGVSRRAFFLFRVREEVDRPVVVDAGGWMPVEHAGTGAMSTGGAGGTEPDSLSRLQAETNLQALADMEYDAVNVGPGDLALDLEALTDLAAGASIHEGGEAQKPVPFVSSDLLTEGPAPWLPVRLRKHGDRSTAILGLSGIAPQDAPAGVRVKSPAKALEEALADVQAEHVVVLSGLDREMNKTLAGMFPRVDLWVESGEREPATVTAGPALIVSTVAKGKAVVRVELPERAPGEPLREVPGGRVRRISMGANVEKHGGIERLLAGFYQDVMAEVMSKPEEQHAAVALFQDSLDFQRHGYVGSDECKDCHAAEYTQWISTHHSKAYRTLQQVNRYYVPACIGCHTVGFGSPTETGFSLVPPAPAAMEGVGCENCHGPGGLHVKRPGRDNIVGKVPPEHCAKCHNPENHPQFEQRKEEMLPLVNHTNMLSAEEGDKPLDLYIQEKLSAGEPLTVHLFVMAQCPYGTQAEQGFMAMKKRFGPLVDLKLHFIARAKGLELKDDPTRKVIPSAGPSCQSSALPEEEDPDAKFSSLHGPSEVAEGRRQVVLLKYYPEQFWDYLECRNKDFESPEWRACATKAGIDADRVESLAASEGDELFKANIITSLENNILSSPTILIDTRLYQGGFEADALARMFCGEDRAREACQDVPRCESHDDCARPGKVGLCVEPGTPQAHCEFFDPVEVRLRVVNAERCPTCSTRQVVQDTMQRLPGLRVENVAHDSEEGRQLIDDFKIENLPAYILGPEVKTAPRFEGMEQDLQEGASGYLLRGERAEADYRVGAPWAALEPAEWLLEEEAEPGAVYHTSFKLSNAGEGDLQITQPYQVRSFSTGVSGSLEQDSEDPKARRIQVHIQVPKEPGPFSYLLVVHTNDPLHPFRLVPLRGMVKGEVKEGESPAPPEAPEGPAPGEHEGH